MAWAGSFRIYELVSRTEGSLDQQITLQWKDVKFGKVKVDGKTIQSVSVHVKSPKVDRVGAGDDIEVVEVYLGAMSQTAESDEPADNFRFSRISIRRTYPNL